MTAHKVELPLKKEDVSIPEKDWWHKMPLLAGSTGFAGVVATFVMAKVKAYPEAISYGAYLVTLLFFISIALGGLFFVLVHFATRAGWSVVVRRIAEFVAATLPVLFLASLPMLLSHAEALHKIYHHWWGVKNPDPVLAGKLGYLNPKFFLIRSFIYFAVWIGISLWYLKTSLRQDRALSEMSSHHFTKKMQWWSYLSLIAFSLTITLAAFDWIMSIDPHWYSTIFGVYFFSGSALSIYATIALFVIYFRRKGLLRGIVTAEHDQDVGKLLFGFTVFWAYIAFSQYMLIWYANIPEETKWFQHRVNGQWAQLSFWLAVGHFVVPFFLLMSKHPKRKPFTLALGALWMLVFHFIDLYWLVMPNLYHSEHLKFEWSHLVPFLTSFIGIGGLFMASFSWWAKGNNLVPVKDPRLPESLKFENF